MTTKCQAGDFDDEVEPTKAVKFREMKVAKDGSIQLSEESRQILAQPKVREALGIDYDIVEELSYKEYIVLRPAKVNV